MVSLTQQRRFRGNARGAPRPGLGAGPDQPVVLAVGRLAAQKGFGLLLEAAARWRDLQPEPLLVIAGEGPLRPS